MQEGRGSAPQPLQHAAAWLKNSFDAISSSAVASGMNCLNIYSVFQVVWPFLPTPLHDCQYLRQLVSALLAFLPLVLQPQQCCRRQQQGRVSISSDLFGALGNTYPMGHVYFTLLWDMRASSQQGNNGELNLLCTVTLHFLQISPHATPSTAPWV